MTDSVPQAGSFVVGDAPAYGGYQGAPQQFGGQPPGQQFGGQLGGQTYAPYVASSFQPAAGSEMMYSSMAAGGMQGMGMQGVQPAQPGYPAQPGFQGAYPAQPGYGQSTGQELGGPQPYGQSTGQGFSGLPSSGSFIANQPGPPGGFSGSPYPNAGHAGQPGFSNPFLAAMYGTLNGMGHDWATQPTQPDPRLPREDLSSAAQMSASALPRAAADGTPRARDEARDTGATLDAKAEKTRTGASKSKRGVKDKKEQPGGFWFWSCS